MNIDSRLHKQIKEYLFGTTTVGLALIVGGILILIIERLPLRARIDSIENIGPMDALKIGIAQTFSLFPGVSRAGATIMGGLLTGLSRTTATEFSFFLAMPVMFAVFFFELIKSYHLLQVADIPMFTVGFVTSFVTALVVVRIFLKYVSGHDFTLFAWYRIIFGALVLVWFWK